jgi:hypothetical protein
MLDFYASTTPWRASHDHNHLRITRIVRSLRLLAGDAEADGFRAKIIDLLGRDLDRINDATRRFWSQA